MSLTLRKRGKKYYVRGTVRRLDGLKHIVKERCTGLTRENEARAFKDRLTRELQDPAYKEHVSRKTFAQAVIEYVQAGKPPRFLDKLVQAFGDLPYDEISNEMLNNEASKYYPHAAPATLRRQWHGPAIAVINFTRDDRLRRPRDGQARVHFFTPTQANLMIEAVKAGRYKSSPAPYIAEYLFGTGARVREAVQSKKSDLFLPYSYVILRNTKNREERRTTLARRTVEAFQEWRMPEQGPIILSLRGTPYTLRKGRGLRFTWWSTAIEKIGLDPDIYTPHVARHSWATWRYSQTKDTLLLMHQGGWSKLELVQRYVKLAAPALAEEARELGWEWAE